MQATDWTNEERAIVDEFLASELFAEMQREVSGTDEIVIDVDMNPRTYGIVFQFSWRDCYTKEERPTIALALYDAAVKIARWLLERGIYHALVFAGPDCPVLEFWPPDSVEKLAEARGIARNIEAPVH